MWNLRWRLALPLALALTAGAAQAQASSIRDRAGLFDTGTVGKAEETLNQIERETKVATTIETIDSLDGQPLDEVAREHAERSGRAGSLF